MAKNTIDGKLLYKMLQGGFASLSHNENYLNDLNIFPVSDSDTGTNMKRTFKKGVAALSSESSVHDMFSTLAKGMSLGSRGNSGFILSQYFQGIHEYTKDKESITLTDFSDALTHAYSIAYKAVIQPTEGTMLTVMREGIKRTLPKVNDTMSAKEFLTILAEEMFQCVQETIKQMDVLRQNNVVDSGALGFYLIFEGMKKALHEDLGHFDCNQNTLLPKRVQPLNNAVSFFRYCTEFTLKLREAKYSDFFISLLKKRGDSIVVAKNESTLKVHVHTNGPKEIMDEFSKYGDITIKKVDDLFDTQEFERLKLRKHKGFVIVAFTHGEGNAMTLEQIGADVAFSVPFGHSPSEKELKNLLSEFLKENLIVFSSHKETRDRLKAIKWWQGFQNLYVAECDGLTKTFFMLSSLIFTDEFRNIKKSLEYLKNQRVFQTSIKGTYDLVGQLKTAANEKILKPYSTVVVFGGKNCDSKDIDIVRAYFESNNNIEFAYYDGGQHDSDFIIGAV